MGGVERAGRSGRGVARERGRREKCGEVGYEGV